MKFFTILGATATGKTALSIQLAQYIQSTYSKNVEIISLDSALIYKHMDIGTAKPTMKDMQGIKHHLIDIINPTQSYSVGNFLQDIKNITQSNQDTVFIIVGGTMLYYNALINGLHDIPTRDENIRQKINQQAMEKGWEYLHTQLLGIDKNLNINPNDSQRIQRALEIYYITKELPSNIYRQHRSSPYTSHTIAIDIDRKVLHERIQKRFHIMIEQGFVQEVENLLHLYPNLDDTYSSIRCVGYRQAYEYINNQITFDEFVEKGIASTRQLAKRQITWLRKIQATNIDSTQANAFDNLCLEFDRYFLV